jgi:hypothetical protein
MLKRLFRRIFTELFNSLPISKSSKIQNGIIISLTSYPARLKSLHFVIRSLLKQSLRAEKIILYLGNDTKDSDIPLKLKKLTKYNFEIRTGYEDIKPHKKYFYAMQEFPEHTIITADDDLIYDKNLVKDLTECAAKNPGCVCARRVNLITKDENGNLNPYSKWKWEYKNETAPSHALIATGCGGILYPPSLLPPKTFDMEAIKENCLNTDDIWLKFMELKNNVKVVFSNNKVVHPLTLRHTQESGLLQTNTSGENRNDINIQKMQDFTGIKLADFI